MTGNVTTVLPAVDAAPQQSLGTIRLLEKKYGLEEGDEIEVQFTTDTHACPTHCTALNALMHVCAHTCMPVRHTHLLA